MYKVIGKEEEFKVGDWVTDRNGITAKVTKIDKTFLQSRLEILLTKKHIAKMKAMHLILYYYEL